ncbi:hypothetical protein FBU59_002019 [Linderina macrospora]|uniref:Uncharacterized protein n=1 Tax=Linderina macrospora TaxID=4868 RepID=A0ACC1JCA0_9FUNG|nr:hypothetical protein FBU59_002019 [Linderina macrospora]
MAPQFWYRVVCRLSIRVAYESVVFLPKSTMRVSGVAKNERSKKLEEVLTTELRREIERS